MSEWLKEHAWKLIPFALSNAHRHAPTHSLATASRNNDVHSSVPVNHGVCPEVQGARDTGLTQNIVRLTGDVVFRRCSRARRCKVKSAAFIAGGHAVDARLSRRTDLVPVGWSALISETMRGVHSSSVRLGVSILLLVTSSRPTGINNLEQRTTQSQTTIIERAVRCLLGPARSSGVKGWSLA
jgi:hypothetical protein